MQLLITLGIYDPERPPQRGWDFKSAVLQVLDWETGKVIREVRYDPPREHIQDNPVMFSGAHALNDELYVCTKTEVLIYSRDSLELRAVHTHPTFNDLHSVLRHDDRLFVGNTGRETVQVLSLKGELLSETNLAHTPTSERFDPEFDYRTIRNTKPHEVHLNQVFELEGEVWATRLLPQDAVAIERPDDRILIPQGQPHDGVRHGDRHDFTTTNGHLIRVDAKTREVELALDLAELHDGDAPLGWCRGASVVDGHAYVAFSRIRDTQHAKYKFWKRSTSEPARPSRVVEIDLKERRVVRSLELEHEGCAVYSVLAWN